MKRSVLAALVIPVLFNSVLLAEAKLEEKVVAPFVPNATYLVSPRGVHLAAVVNKGSRAIIVVDGVESPKFDQVLSIDGKPFSGQTPIVFSDDGEHYAYCGRIGQELVVVLDGKELVRLPYNVSILNYGPLDFASGGKRLWFVAWDQQSTKYTLYLDGKPQPVSGVAPQPVFSRDGERYFYVASDPADNTRQFLLVDGNKVDWGGDQIQFTADGKHIVSIDRAADGSSMQLLVDGKPTASALAFSKIDVAPAGGRVTATASRAGTTSGVNFIIVDGKPVPESECLYGIDRVVFSPDGKRYAARCKAQSSAWLVVDGKKTLEYQGIADEMIFSADSSRFAFVASNANQQFVVVDGEESNGYPMIFTKPVFDPSGKHVAYIAGTNRLNLETVVDGKVVSKMPDASVIQFSQDGSRIAIRQVGMGNGLSVIDGKENAELITSDLAFSPDGKHLAIVGQRVKDRQNGLFVDGGLVFKQTSRFTRMPRFSPDGKHLYWSHLEVNASVQPPRQTVIFVDGQPMGKWNADTGAMLEGLPEAWEIGADGVLTTLVVADEGVKRLRITPDPDMTIEKIVENTKAAEAKAIADAEAAKQAAADEAARKKAEAEAAKKKAAEDAARARQEALDARKKAQEEAAAKRAEQQRQRQQQNQR